MFTPVTTLIFMFACGPKTPPPPPVEPVKVDYKEVVCADGTEQVGAPPPEGHKLWCRQRLPNGQWQDHGDQLSWYKSGTKMMGGPVVNGKKSGVWYAWYENGEIHTEQTYVNNKLEGLSQEWWPSGGHKAEGQMVVGREDGAWTYWHENGQVHKTGSWTDQGPDGRWIEYNEQGVAIILRQYAFGRMLSHSELTGGEIPE